MNYKINKDLWMARIKFINRSYYLGYFSTPEEAAAVNLEARNIIEDGYRDIEIRLLLLRDRLGIKPQKRVR